MVQDPRTGNLVAPSTHRPDRDPRVELDVDSVHEDGGRSSEAGGEGVRSAVDDTVVDAHVRTDSGDPGSQVECGSAALFIWQGVTYFLQPEGIDSTLAFIANHSAPGSSVVFDYVYNETLHDTTQGYGKALARAGKVSGEPYVFGIDRGTVGTFLAQRGFCDVVDMPIEDLKPTYFTGANAARPIVADAIAIASARVCRSQ